MHAYEYNKKDELRMMLRRTGIVEPIFFTGVWIVRYYSLHKRGSTMSNCKTCSQEISWDAKKREVFKMELYASVIKSKKQPIGILTGGATNQMVAVEKENQPLNRTSTSNANTDD